MSTPVSASSAYCPVGIMIRLTDLRRICDLCGDSGAKILGAEIAQASDGTTLPQATIYFSYTAPGTTGFAASGTVSVWSSSAVAVQTITYTGITGSTFTGCTGGTGTLAVTDPIGPILTNPKFLQCGLTAAGDIESACCAGNRYSPTDLQTLTGASKAALQKLNAKIWMYHLERRRNPAKPLTDDEELTFLTLERLRHGEWIFGLQEVMDAGTGVDTTQLDQSMIQTLGLNTRQAQRYFGTRTQTRRLYGQ